MRLNTFSNLLATEGSFTVTYNKATLLFLSVVFSLALSMWVGYRLAYFKLLSIQNTQTSLVFYPEQTYPSAMDEHQLQVLTAHIGRIEANLMRVNALGERLVELASLDPQEFNFQQEVPMGGPLSLTWNNENILQTIKIFEEILAKRYTQLNTLVFSLQMKKSQNEISLDGLGKPIKNGWISSFFGPRIDPFTGHKALHTGVDIVGKEGDEVKALAGGIVSFANKNGGYGHLVEIKHANGLSTRYGHNKTILVQPGQWVKKGQTIALLGSSGRSTGPHLHLEVHRNGKAVDPGNYFPDLRK